MTEIVPHDNVDKTVFLADYLQKQNPREPELIDLYQKEIESIKNDKTNS